MGGVILGKTRELGSTSLIRASGYNSESQVLNPIPRSVEKEMDVCGINPVVELKVQALSAF